MRILGSTTRVWGSPGAQGESENLNFVELWEEQNLNPAKFGSPEPSHTTWGWTFPAPVWSQEFLGWAIPLLVQSLSGNKRGLENASLKVQIRKCQSGSANQKILSAFLGQKGKFLLALLGTGRGDSLSTLRMGMGNSLSCFRDRKGEFTRPF